MIKMGARLPESLNGKKPGPDLKSPESSNISKWLKNKWKYIYPHDSWNCDSVKKFIFDDGELPLFARWSDVKSYWVS